ncbi:MAG: ribose 5-phosphate isomerase B [Pelolinea sp.]|nr:ribose 5-phosphate isomerase B [Pelolinea sp.]
MIHAKKDNLKVLIGSDSIGFFLKEDLKNYLMKIGHEVVDFGVDNSESSIDYPDIAIELAQAISRGESDRGILICGTGLGMAITANKVPGIRAATCHDPYSAERARKSNDAQIITFGAKIIAPTLACVLIEHWLASEFEGGRSIRKVEKIKALDLRKYHLSEQK